MDVLLRALLPMVLICICFNPAQANPRGEPSAKPGPEKQKPDSYIREMMESMDPATSIDKHMKWRASLPRCAPGDSGLLEDWSGYGEVAGLRGVLVPGRGWFCTAMYCQNIRCCNPCTNELKFVSRMEFLKKGVEGKGVPIRLPVQSYLLKYSAMDCAVDSLDKLPFLEGVVSGRTGDEGAIVNADLCVMGELPRSSSTPVPGKRYRDEAPK